MKNKFHPLLTLIFCLITIPITAQVATTTGSIYGKVLDDKDAPVPGVNVQLESDIIPSQSATTGPSGAFRFANLPPGNYASTFNLPGFTEVRQEGLRITVGLNIELKIILKASPVLELMVVGETPLVDTQKTGNEYSYTREYLDQIPGGRDPWFVLEQTPGIDSDRYNVAGSESGKQSAFFARGGNDQSIWNYDGMNMSEFGGAPAYLDFDSLEEIEIVTGGNDASIQTGAVVINLVTKRGGNEWHANGSYYFVDDYFQSNNTPEELIDDPIINPITGEPAKGSTRTHQINEYGFDIGGPVLKDRLFIWGAYRRNQMEHFSIADVPDNTRLLDYTFKASFNFNSEHELQFGYLWGDKSKQGIGSNDQAPEALRDQKSFVGTTPLEGIWTATHTWIPNDHTILTGRYGWYSASWGLIPRGGKDVPMIYLAAIPHWEDTFDYQSPIERTAHDVNIDANYFKEDWIGGDHEFKYGFVYQTETAHTFSSWGNGVFLIDYNQTVANGPLTSGFGYARLDIDGRVSDSQYGFYASDTFRKNSWTFNLGVRFDHQAGKNAPASIRGVPGFEQFVGPIEYPGGDPVIAFNNISPRAGVTYELRDNMVLRGNFARYYNAFDLGLTAFSNPAYGYNGALFSYVNRNGDRTITPDELVGDPIYYGVSGAEFDLDAYLAKRKYDPDLSNTWTNEVIAGIESEVLKDLSISAAYTYRRYGDILFEVPFGISTADYVLADTPFHMDTPIGSFDVPYYKLPSDFQHDGTGIFQNVDNFRRTYHGLDLVVRKRMSQNFLLSGSLTLQKQKAHYDGEGSLAFVPFLRPGATWAFDPTNLPFVDDRTYAFFGRIGVRPFSEWYLKISGYYQLPWEIGVGAFLRYQQGYPYLISGYVPDPKLIDFYGEFLHSFFVEPFGSRRLDNKFTLDLRVEKGIELGRHGRLTAIVDLFNVTNENAVLSRNQNLRHPQFYQIQEVLSPRALRFGLRFSY